MRGKQRQAQVILFPHESCMARLLREVVDSNQSESTHADLQKEQGPGRLGAS